MNRTKESLQAELKRRKKRLKVLRNKYHHFKGWVKAMQAGSPGSRNTTKIKIFNAWAKDCDKGIGANLDKIAQVEYYLKAV